MKTSKNCSSGLDIQKEYVTLAQYVPDDHAVTMVAIQPVESADTGGFPLRELKTLKNKFKFSGTPVACSLAGDNAIVKKIQVDNNEKNIHDVVKWELGQQIIGDPEDYAWDYQECGTGTDSLKQVLLAAYRQDTMDDLYLLLKQNKMAPVVVDLDLFALINVFEANYDDLISQQVGLVHAEADHAAVVLTQNGTYLEHECFTYGMNTDARGFAGQLQAAVQRIGVGTVPLFCAGSLFTQEGYLDSVRQLYQNFDLLHPFRKVGCRIGVDNEQLSGYLPQLAIAVGLALRGNE